MGGKDSGESPTLHDKIGELLIITLGRNGSVLFDADNAIHVKSLEVEAIETTGAGDSYIGAFAARLLMGDDFAASAGYASAAAAVTVTKIGALSAMPTARELEAIVPSISGRVI